MVASSDSGICWPAGRRHQQVADFASAGAELRVHADDQIEELFALDDLGGGLAADGRLHHGADIIDIDAVARDFGAVGLMVRLGWPSSRTTVSSLKPGVWSSTRLISTALLSQHVQVGAEDLDGQRALEPGEGFVDGVFGRLRVVEDHAGIGGEFLPEVFDEIRFGVDRSSAARFCRCRAAARHRIRS